MKALVEAKKPLSTGELYIALYGEGERTISQKVSARATLRRLRERGWVLVVQEVIDGRATNIYRPHPDYEQ